MKNGKYVEINRMGGYVTEWYQDGKLHREDGPAREYANGSKEWWVNGKLHREDGPAVERTNGSKEWWLNGKLHREDGPACEYANGSKEWWVNGRKTAEQKVQQVEQETQHQLAQETQQQLAQETQRQLASHDIDIAPDSVTFDMIEQCDNFRQKSVLIDLYGLDRYWNEKVARNQS